MTPLERLMQDATKALEQLLGLLCLDPTHVAPSLSHSGSDMFLDIVVAASTRDEATLRDTGGDTALATLAGIIGTQSGLATVSIQIE